MATFVTHAVVPWLAGRRALPAEVRKRVAAVALLCATLPDLDLVSYAYDVRPPSAWAHRGLTHSLGFAALASLLLCLVLLGLSRRTRTWLPRAWALGFAAGASHGLIDMFTRGEVGVAYFWPVSSHRYLLPFHPVPVVPMGADEMLGRWGVVVLLNEVLLLWVPVLLLMLALSLRREGQPLKRAGVATAVWLAVLVGLKLSFPEQIAPQPDRPLRSFGPPGWWEDPADIPVKGLPGERLVTRLDELKALGLFNAELAPAQTPWSSTFFPNWFGGTAGRWKDGRWTLIGRTLTGFAPLEAAPARALVEQAQHDPLAAERLFRLAPTEKYDLALGDFGFTSTRLSLSGSHNLRPRPRFWWGICNGIAAASLARPEPFRTVDVVNPLGETVRFHPNDVKALLGWSYYWLANSPTLGGPCNTLSLDPTGTCGMNPGGLVLALLNRIGLAHDSFLIDVHPTPQSQHYAIASARVMLTRGPYPYDRRPVSQMLAPKVVSLADVDVRLELSATTLPVKAGDVPTGDPTRYQKVGLHPVPFEWAATLALDDAGTIVGGAWTDTGPDELTFIGGGPLLDGGVLEVAPAVRWDLVDAIAKASVEDSPGVPTVIAANVLDGGSLGAGALDGGSLDGGSLDAGALDGGSLDGGSLDGGSLDAGALDGGSLDGGSLDAGALDAGAHRPADP